MKANTGMNLLGFFEVVENITKLRNESLDQTLPSERLHIEDFDDDQLMNSIHSIVSNLSSLCKSVIRNEPNIAESIVVPHEIIDFCYLTPVVADMCSYYEKKQLLEKSRFVEVLNICLSRLKSYGNYVAENWKL